MLVLLLALLSTTAPARDTGEIRGVTVSCPTSGWEWGSDAMVRTLDELEALGASWVAIHPYARIQADGTVQWRPIDPEQPPDWLERPIREAHARGLKVLIKPHLAYWGSPFSWRGEIGFEDESSWQRFFDSYGRWIATLASASGTADGFAVGTELDRTTHREAEWREVIAQVRGRYPGAITYAANWDAVERVPFWDAVDTIGIQAYFPLLTTPGQTPDRGAIDEGWNRIMGDLRALHQRTGKHIVFTELGYPRSERAAHEPWTHADDPAQAPLQALLLDAALDAIEREPAVIGAFLWKWFPGEALPRNFALQRPEPRAILGRHWTAP